jgi:hypothetical protein
MTESATAVAEAVSTGERITQVVRGVRIASHTLGAINDVKEGNIEGALSNVVSGALAGFEVAGFNPCNATSALKWTYRGLQAAQAGFAVNSAVQAVGNANLNDPLSILEAGWAAYGAYNATKSASEEIMRSCFVAGTPLLVPGGSKVIEQLVPGDEVLCRGEYDPEGSVETRVVEEVFVRTGQLLWLRVAGRMIGTSGEHPFWVRGKGWAAAAQLRIGDELSSHDGRWVVVEGIEAKEEYATLYNVKVAEHHTYFVGCKDWGWSVWAHNEYRWYTEEEVGQILRDTNVPEDLIPRLVRLGAREGIDGEDWVTDMARFPKSYSDAEWAQYTHENETTATGAMAYHYPLDAGAADSVPRLFDTTEIFDTIRQHIDGDVQTLTLPTQKAGEEGWDAGRRELRDAYGSNPDRQIVYILRDGTTGEVYKVGKTSVGENGTAINQRFMSQYARSLGDFLRANADECGPVNMVVDYAFIRATSISEETPTQHYEETMRTELEGRNFPLLWDNTSPEIGAPGRLGFDGDAQLNRNPAIYANWVANRLQP